VTVRNDEPDGWVAVRYEREGEVLEAIFNPSSDSRVVPLDGRRQWSIVLSTDAPGYGGSGVAALEKGLGLPAWGAALIRGTAA
jgi:hypothetical protein